ncbi:hypothetical protein [Actinoplanes sp. G11-F43]|uniref:hypothetical protein n=1 Tax=Actinoplanes sp. G11-F43 TaxID=3424130 RepID=UPI003D34CCCF
MAVIDLILLSVARKISDLTAWGAAFIDEVLRWGALAIAALCMIVFLGSQHENIQISYAQSPVDTSTTPPTIGAGDATIPSVAEITAMLRDDPVVRLPGSVAHWDTEVVAAAIGDSGLRILVTPPGIDEASHERLGELDDADIRIIGTYVGTGTIAIGSSHLDDWRGKFAVGDVTSDLQVIIAELRGQPKPETVDPFRWREPTAAETEVVARDLRAGGFHRAAGATLEAAPENSPAFPDGRALYVALPQQPFGEPTPEYGPALARLFPDTPIVVMYGNWIEYSGPHAADFAETAGAIFYDRAELLLQRAAYPQQAALTVYLDQVTDVRYAGLADRPLPYAPPDPLDVALPALPWIFVICVLVFVGLSLRPIVGTPADAGVRRAAGSAPAQLAALTTLAVEMSALTGRRSEAPLARALITLTAARDALRTKLPDQHVRSLLRTAEKELDVAARLLPYRGYRPAEYFERQLS